MNCYKIDIRDTTPLPNKIGQTLHTPERYTQFELWANKQKYFKLQTNIVADELTDICDENNNLLDIRKMKSEAHKNGLWHRASHIWIYNSNGEILLQLRAKEKPLYPDMWDISVAGHISAGEDPITSGIREVEEEIGLRPKKEDLDFWMIRKVKTIFREIKNNEFYYVYFFRFDGDSNQLKLQKEEVQKIQFLPIDKIKEELKINPGNYVHHGDYWFEVLNEIKKKLVS